jgi:hypothetical protein
LLFSEKCGIIYIEKEKGERTMNKPKFLLEFDMNNIQCDLPDLPQVTLWKTFDEAFAVALQAAVDCGVVVDFTEVVVDLLDGVLFIPDFCEIMPISLSKLGKVTWLGKKWTPEEEEK